MSSFLKEQISKFTLPLTHINEDEKIDTTIDVPMLFNTPISRRLSLTLHSGSPLPSRLAPSVVVLHQERRRSSILNTALPFLEVF